MCFEVPNKACCTIETVCEFLLDPSIGSELFDFPDGSGVGAGGDEPQERQHTVQDEVAPCITRGRQIDILNVIMME